MGKLRDIYDDAKVIYKKSHNTVTTQSRTCSSASQFQNKYAITEHRSSTNRIVTEKGKRDFSIETEICILRRQYGNRRYKLSQKNKSKYSLGYCKDVNNDEAETDGSGCGDNENKEAVKSRKDVTRILLDNLKGLINCLIRNYLLDNGANEQRKATVLDSIFHQKEEHVDEKASCSTYILNKSNINRANRNQCLGTSVLCKYCDRKTFVAKRSSKSGKIITIHSCPGSFKKLRGISTLSVPRTINKNKESFYKARQIRRKHVILSFRESNELLECSSFDLLAVSTNSLSKRFGTYQVRERQERRDKGIMATKSFSKTASSCRVKTRNTQANGSCGNSEIEGTINVLHIDEATSLLKTIYAENDIKNQQFSNDPEHENGHVESNPSPENKTIIRHDIEEIKIHKNKLRNEVNTLISNEYNDSLKSDKIINESFKSDTKIIHNEEPTHSFCEKTNISNTKMALNRKIKQKKMLKANKPKRNRNNNFTYYYKNIQAKETRIDYLQYLKSIFEYLTDNKRIKLEINVDVHPNRSKKMKSKFACVSGHDLTLNTANIQKTDKYNAKPSRISINVNTENRKSQEIIPILDGAVSQTEYLYNEENTTINSNTTKNTNKSYNAQIIREIQELRSDIKVLSAKADKIVSEQIRRESIKPECQSIDSKNFLGKHSKGIQITNNLKKDTPLSGLKISKEPKKEMDFYTRMMKRSSSYKVIDSESVIKVTDMTLPYDSYAEQNVGKYVDEALYCSLPKSKSLFEINNQYVAYYCEKCSNCSNSFSKDKIERKRKKCPVTNSSCECNDESGETCDAPAMRDSNVQSFPDCSTISINDDQDLEMDKVVVLHRNGMGFGEGLIYCLILWIPAIITACLFYDYVLKDILFPRSRSHKLNSKGFNLNLTDLGF